MVKYCPSCGTKLEKEYNFCPECGFDLRNLAEGASAGEPPETHTEEVILCDNCGEENPVDNKVCKYCGGVLKGSQVEKIVTTKKPEKEKVRETRPKGNKQKESRPKQNKLKSTAAKKTSPAGTESSLIRKNSL